MARYRVRWVESWERTATVDLDEDVLREWAEVPIGPLRWLTVVEYLEETDGSGYEWHPNTMPDQWVDNFYGLEVLSIDDQRGGT
jgi:hypothetical protein